jgi:hypothetical protein
MRSFAFLVLCVFAALGSLSCGNNIKSSTTTYIVTITITPTSATVGLGGTAQFTATASGCTNTNVTWEVNGIVGGNSTYGTVSASGLYTAPAKFSTPTTVTITAVSQCNTTYLANVPVTLSSGVTVSVSPSSANLQLGQTQQFASAVNGSTNTGVNWLAGGVAGGNSTYGTISSSGLYTAPSTLANTPTAVAVTAVSQVDSSKTGTASVIVHGGVSVTVTPSPVAVSTFGSQQFTPAVTGTSNTGITWEVNGVVGGSAATGTISATGLFSAPNSVPTKASNGKSVASAVTVTAISQGDSTALANVTVTMQPPNQAQQKTPISLGVSGGNAGDTGVSGSSATCCGGTLGALVSRGGNQYILGASHVLARNDDGSVGDTIIQPGLIDSRCSTANTTTVANLSQFVNLESPPTTTPFVDAALAKVISGQVDPLGIILQLGATTDNGQPTDAPPHAGKGVAPSLGLAIAKSGRTTGLTCSPITAINGVVTVQYQKGCGTGSSFTATFSDLVIVGLPSGSNGQNFSAEGDSGSLLVTQDNSDPVALLVASSDTDTVAAPVSDVLAALADPSTSEQPVFVGTASAHTVAACSLAGPQLAAAAASAQVTAPPTTEKLQAATATRDLHAAELLGHSQVRAVGVGPSLDQPGEAAILLVVPKGASLGGLPAQVDTQRTRIIQAADIAREGILTLAESASLAQDSPPSNSVTALPDAEASRARTVQAAHLASLMKGDGIQGVAITSSVDNPSEAALLVLVIRGSTHEPIPAVLDGLRTRIRESTPFRSGLASANSNSACQRAKSSRQSIPGSR